MTEDERRAYAKYMINKRAHSHSVDVEMFAPEVLGYYLTVDDFTAVQELIDSAAITVTWPDAPP